MCRSNCLPQQQLYIAGSRQTQRPPFWRDLQLAFLWTNVIHTLSVHLQDNAQSRSVLDVQMLGLSFACTSNMQRPICTYICRRWHLKNWLLESFLLWMLCSHLYKSSNQILCHQQSVILSDMAGWEGVFIQTSFQQKTVFLTNTILEHNIKYAVGFVLNPSFSHHCQIWLIR